MPNTLSPADRKLVRISVSIAAVLIGCSMLVGLGGGGEESEVPSTYSSSSGGARAAFLLLEKLHYPVRRWEESPTGLEKLNGAVVVLADPNLEPEASEAAALRRFVQGGGRVLFCGGAIGKFFRGAEVERPGAGRQWQTFEALIPSVYTRRAARVLMEPRTRWNKLQASQTALYGSPDTPVAVAWRIGSGEVIWWAAPTPLTNAAILKDGNLALLLNAVSQAHGEPMAVYWDEYFHGQRTSLWSYVARTPVKWALWQAALFCLLVIFTFSRRWGPVIPTGVRSRLSPLEFVDALGGLYERAGATAVPAGVAYKRLRLALTSRLMVPGSIANADLARSAGMRLGFDEGKLADLLARGEVAGWEALKPSQALRLVQELDEGFIQLTERR